MSNKGSKHDGPWLYPESCGLVGMAEAVIETLRGVGNNGGGGRGGSQPGYPSQPRAAVAQGVKAGWVCGLPPARYFSIVGQIIRWRNWLTGWQSAEHRAEVGWRAVGLVSV